MVCVQKVTVSGVLVFLERSPTQQQSLGLIFAGIWSHAYFALSPFKREHDNNIARVSSASLCFILLAALLLPNDVPPTGWRRDYGAPLLIMFTAAPIAMVLWAICVELCPLCCTRGKKEEKEEEEGKEEEKETEQVPSVDVTVDVVPSVPDDGGVELSAASPPVPEARLMIMCCADS